MDCCVYISFAISSGLVKMLFCLSMIESRGEDSEFLKTFLFIFLGFFSYSVLYLDIAFRMHSLVYFVVMFFACLLAVFAMVAISSIHIFGEMFVIGGLGICTCWWLCISFSIGCVCQFGSFFVIYIIFSD